MPEVEDASCDHDGERERRDAGGDASSDRRRPRVRPPPRRGGRQRDRVRSADGLVSLLGYVIIGRLGAEVETTVDTTRTETRATLYEDENSPFGAKRTQERADAFQARNN